MDLEPRVKLKRPVIRVRETTQKIPSKAQKRSKPPKITPGEPQKARNNTQKNPESPKKGP
jgi:hypothetical protein